MNDTIAPLHALADALGGTVLDERILTPERHVVYCAITGVVKLQRYGLPVAALGSFRDVEGCAAEYARLTAVAA